MTRPAAHCGPLSLVAASVLGLVASLLVDDWRVGLVTLVVELALVPLAAASVRPLLVRGAPVLLAAAAVGWSTWLSGPGVGVGTTAAAALRILVLVLPGLVLLPLVEPSALGDALAQRLHLPARPVVAAVAAVERLEALDDSWRELRQARWARGLGPTRSPASRARFLAGLTFGLLVETLRRSERTAVALDARGYAGARHRTWAEPSPWRTADTVLVLIALLVPAAPLVLRALL